MPRRRRPERPRAEWLLSQGATVEAVAAELGVPAGSVYRWAAELPEVVPFAPPLPPPPTTTATATGARVAPLRLVQAAPETERPLDGELLGADCDDEPATDEELVEAAIGLGWSARLRRGLVERLGLSEDEVDALRVRVLERAGHDLQRGPIEQIAEFTLRIRHAQGVAIRRADLGALTRLLSLEGRVLGMDRLRVDVGTSAEQFVVVAPTTHRLDS